jgi:hypothetical protein
MKWPTPKWQIDELYRHRGKLQAKYDFLFKKLDP